MRPWIGRAVALVLGALAGYATGFAASFLFDVLPHGGMW